MIGPKLTSGAFESFRCKTYRECHRIGAVRQQELVVHSAASGKTSYCNDESALSTRQWQIIRILMPKTRAEEARSRASARALLASATAIIACGAR